MKSSLLFTVVISLTWAASEGIAQESSGEQRSKVVLASKIEWNQLNPARGDNSPKAATLWGDRNGAGQTGFLVKFLDGFKSPPHIHNVAYRGIVIGGFIHNNDPAAATMWMPPGSFWTQPAGQVHITAAIGSENVAYIEIEKGPYLVLPTEEAFDDGDRPVNVDVSNIVWLDASNTNWIDQAEMSAATGGAKIAFLWGNPRDDELRGTLIRLPKGFTGRIRSHGSTFRAVVIQGQPDLQMQGETDVISLTPGSYFSSMGDSVHELTSETEEESIIYVRTNGKFKVIPAQSKK